MHSVTGEELYSEARRPSGWIGGANSSASSGLGEFACGVLRTQIVLRWHLMGVHLTGVHLMGMHLVGVHLVGVHLVGVHLIGVVLLGVVPLGKAALGRGEIRIISIKQNGQ